MNGVKRLRRQRKLVEDLHRKVWVAILPAATAELHLIGDVPEYRRKFGTGDKVAGIDGSSSSTESGLSATLHTIVIGADDAILKKQQKGSVTNDLLTTWYLSTLGILNQTTFQFTAILPRILAALIIIIVGAAIARAIRHLVIRILMSIKLTTLTKNTPIEHFVTNAELTQKIEEIIGSIIYWLLMIIVLQTAVSVLGLEPLSQILSRFINYLPQVLSAVFVLFFGILLAGVMESVIKGAIKTIDGRSGRVLGKVASYLVMTLAVLIAVSELGIASNFILILFIGLVATLSLGVGLAFGLGGQDVVREFLREWYQRWRQDTLE